MPSLNSLISTARSSQSAGGERLYKSEAKKISAHITRDSMVSAAEAKALRGILGDGNLTRSAEKLLTKTLELRGDSNDRPGSDAFKLTTGSAADLATAYQRGDNPLKEVGVSERKEILNTAIAALDENSGRSARARQARSDAFTVAFSALTSLPKSRSTSRLIGSAVDALLDAARNEQHPRLQKHMVRLLADIDLGKKISKTDKKDIERLFSDVIPQKYDVANIVGDDGYVEWTHYTGHGENMYRSFLTNMQNQKLLGAKFELVEKTADGAILEATFKSPKGPEQIEGIRIHVEHYQHNMFDLVGEPTGISYGGHSDTGNNQEKSLAKAIRDGKVAENPQLILLDLCAGLDGLDDALESLGNVEVLTTVDSSYYGKANLKDEDGKFEGVESYEMTPTLLSTWTSIIKGEDYTKMRRRIASGLESDDHVYHPNYVTPTLKDYRAMRWAHLDIDDDGTSDALDIHFRFDVKDRKSTNSLKPKNVRSDVGAINGDTVRDAVLDLNVSTHYNALMSEDYGIAHQFISGGFIEAAAGEPLVQFINGENSDGESLVQVVVDKRLAGASREALAALVHYEAVMFLADEDWVDLSETDRKLMGLVFAAARLGCDGKARSNDQKVWRSLLDATNLPSIPFSGIAAKLDAEYGDYTGNMKHVAYLKSELSQSAKSKLRRSDVGRTGQAVA